MGEMRGRIPVMVCLATVAVAVGGALGSLDHPVSPVPVGAVAAAATTTTASGMARVHVSGMVRAPGVVDVPEGGIVADAIDAAGGLRVDAVVDRINLAAPVADGDQVVVPGPGDQVDVGNPGQPGGGLISLSTATAAELETLPGVGPVLAERIVSFRDQSGRFDEVEKLLEVPGIGEAKLAAIRDLVRP